MISSVIPWQKYSWSLPGLISTKGSTAIEQFTRRAIASIRVFLERLVDDDLERSRQGGLQGEERRLGPVQEMIEDCRSRIALKRRSPCRHFEEHDSQRKQIRARIERPPEGLFRRHVPGCSDRTSPAALLCCGRRPLRVPGGDRLEELRHTEVENLDALVVGNHDVARLQIAVHDSDRVGTGQRVSHLSGERDRLREWKPGAAAQELTQAAALNELHRDEHEVGGFLHRVEVNDVGVIERSRRSGLAQEPRSTFARFADVRTGKLESDAPMESRVLGEVDVSHSAASELVQHPVMTKLAADQWHKRTRLTGDGHRRKHGLSAAAACGARCALVPDAGSA
jgi:hypothetical protein